MPIKGKRTKTSKTSEPKENPEINAKIDACMAENPKLVERLESYSKERLVRMHVLNHIDREESINRSIQNEWESNPEKKAALETLVAHLPKEKQEEAMISLARQTKVQESRAQRAQPAKQNEKPASPGISV
ncbi:MAG: hypothetical protein ACQKBY_08345 [Verrucomicrobiales bacterium]